MKKLLTTMNVASKGIRFLRDSWLRAVEQAREAVRGHTVTDYREFCGVGPTQRALVSYLTRPLLLPPSQRDDITFSNLGIAQQIPRALNELGYVVDVIQYDDRAWRPSEGYHLFIGHGGINFEQVSRCLSAEVVRIYFSSGIYWKEWNAREAIRLHDLALRRGYLLMPDRAIQHSEEYANRVADGIICLGNESALRTYSQFPLAIGINNATYPITWRGWQDKDFETGRSHFLFFSGGGNIHKGLDLLLEAFAGTELHLHVCQQLDERFSEVYHHELFGCSNVHVYGWVPMRSAQFLSLVERCNWVISATCAEGQPGAVIECMGHGLIPVLPDTANIDLRDFGIPLPECQVETIRRTACDAAQMPPADCRRRALAVASVVREEYSPEVFTCSFKMAVLRILQETGRSTARVSEDSSARCRAADSNRP